MNKPIQLLLGVVVAFALSLAPISAQEYGVKWTRVASHITTKTTTHIATASAVLHTLIITVSTAGTSWTVTVQNLDTTPKILYSATVAAGTTVIELPVGITMAGGIDVVTAGTTAGIMDVFCTFR